MAQKRRKPMSKKKGAAIGAGFGAAITAKQVLVHHSMISNVAREHGKGAVWAGVAGGAAINMGLGAGIGAAAAHISKKQHEKVHVRAQGSNKHSIKVRKH